MTRNNITHMAEEDYLDVHQCNDCGAYAKTEGAIEHHATCTPGESEYWEKFYSESEGA